MNQNKLFVGSLPYHVTEDELKNLFSSFGEIKSVHIVTDKMTGRSKGFGFVEMGTSESAQRALEELNGKEYEGRTLIVNEARPQQPRERTERAPRSFNNKRPNRSPRSY